MSKWTLCVALGCLALGGLVRARADEASDAVPPAMRGVWGRQGRCDVPADRLTITARTAGWGSGPFKPVSYSAGDGAVLWAEEYEVDNFVPGRNSDLLVHNAQGFGMPGQEGYARCGPGLARRPWPFPPSSQE